MRMILKKATCLLLVIAGCLIGCAIGAARSGSAPAAGQIQEERLDPVEEFRKERQQLRQAQISQLNEMILSGHASAEIIPMAQERLLELMAWSEQELTMEGVLEMRGFGRPVVTVHNDSVNVLVRSEQLNAQQAAIILEIVIRETGISGENVKIMPVN